MASEVKKELSLGSVVQLRGKVISATGSQVRIQLEDGQAVTTDRQLARLIDGKSS